MKRRIFGLENEYGLTCTLNGQRRLSPDNVARYLVREGHPRRPQRQRLPRERRAALPRHRLPPRVRDARVRRRGRARHPRQGRRAHRRGPAAPGREAPARGRASPATSCSSRTTPTRRATPTAATRTTWSAATSASSAWPRRSSPSSSPGRSSRAPARCCRRRAAFTIASSQRAQHICQEISGATTSSRSIINTRDEPHADAERYRRLHVIVGDSNMSEVATYLKIGTTAIVLDMIEDGFFDRDYSLQSPVQAIRDISHDPTLKETIKLKDGRSISGPAAAAGVPRVRHPLRGHGSPDPITQGSARCAGPTCWRSSSPTPCSSTASWTG